MGFSIISLSKVYYHKQYHSYNDPFFKFWSAFAYFKQQSVGEAINELIEIQNKREIQFATYSALIVYHQSQKSLDREAIDEFKQKFEEARIMSNEKALCLGAHFYLLINNMRGCDQILNSIVGQNIGINNIRGWIAILKGDQSALQMFNQNLEENSKHLESLMGRAKASELQKKFTVTIDTLNEIAVEYPDFLPAQIEKAKVLMIIGDWEQSITTAERVLEDQPDNISAQKVILFNLIAREGNIETFIEKFNELQNSLDNIEPNNSELYLSISKLFARISGRNKDIINLTLKMLQKCRKFDPLNADNALEIAEQYLILKDYQESFNYFQETASLDESKIEALSGMIHCKIKQGQIDDAEKQIEFVNEIQISEGGRTSYVAFLEGLLSYKKGQKQSDTVKFLDEALKLHINMTKSLIPGLEFYVKLNPDYLMSIAEEYLQYITMDQVMKEQESAQPLVLKGNKLLETIVKQIPGFIPAHLLLAKGKLAVRDASSALKSIQKCLEMDPENQEAAILHALISLREGNYQGAANSLDQAISYNFKIRDNPLFMLVKGQVELESKDYVSCLQSMESAFLLPGIQDPSKLQYQNGVLSFGEGDRCQVYLLLSKAQAFNKQYEKAKQTIQDAITEWAGSDYEVQVLITNSEIAVETGDIKKALSILRAVDNDSLYFAESRKLMAEIYLKNLKDRRHFAKCYADLIDHNETFENYRLLGNALLRIQEPGDALLAFQNAQRLNPNDEKTIRDIGQALVQTHQFNKALQYYSQALKQRENNTDLKLDLGKLFTMIGQLDKAELILKPELFSDDFQTPTLDVLKRNVDGFKSIHTLILKKKGPCDQARKCLEKSIQIQGDVVERCKVEGGGVDVQKKYTGLLYLELAKYLVQYEKNDIKALNYLDRSLKYAPDNQEILKQIIDINFRTQDYDSCKQKCLQLLKINPSSDYASFMISELLIKNDESSKASEQFKKLLQENPDNYGILSKMIEYLQHTDQLYQAKQYVTNAEKKATNPNDPGLCYCRGIYYKFMRKSSDAIKEFNKAKRFQAYLEDSIAQMVDIFLNPQQELYFSFSDENSYLKAVNPDNIRSAESLLNEIKGKTNNRDLFLVLHSYVLMYSKQKGSIDQAIQMLQSVLQENENYPPALLALSVAKYLNRKQNDTKSLLKQLIMMPYSTEFAEVLEKAWLMSADSLIGNQRYDDAQQLLQQCLKYNQGSGKAWEFMGLIHEKQQSYQQAAEYYEKAWILTQMKSATIGFRLASNYMKINKFVQAINISELVLKEYPDYPKIEKDILYKAQNNLKLASTAF